MGKALGISNVTIGAGDGAGLPSAPAGILGLAGSYRYSDPKNDGTPDAHGTRTLELLITITPPSPLGTFLGGHVWYEYPDQSFTDDFVLNGTSPLNGTINLNGPWKPTSAGKFPFNSDGAPWVIKGLKVPVSNVGIRVYVVPYSKNEDNVPVRANLPSPSPSIVIAVAPPLTTASGEEYTQNVTGFAVTVTSGIEGGVNITHVKTIFTPPKDARWGGVEIVVRHPNAEDEVLGVFTKTGTDSKFQTPSAGENGTIFAVSFAGKSPEAGGGSRSVNTLIPGVTPSQVVTIGTVSGTLDPSQLLPAGLGSALAIVNLVLNVKSQGITQALVADFAIASQQLALAAVATGNVASSAITTALLATGAVTTPKIASANITTALIANAAITTALIGTAQITTALIANASITTALIGTAQITTALIANAAITTALIANLAVLDAQIGSLSAGKINTGTLNAITITGCTLTLTAGGATTQIDNSADGNGNPIGLSVADSVTSRIEITPYYLTGFSAISGHHKTTVVDASANGTFEVFGPFSSVNPIALLKGFVSGGTSCGILEVSGDAGPQVHIHGTGAGLGLLVNFTQVIGPQQTGPGAPSFASFANVQTWCAALLTALQTHGIVT